MKLNDTQLKEVIGVLTDDAAARAMGEAVAIRKIECVTQAATKLFGNVSDSWRDRVDVTDPAIKAKVVKEIQSIGYPIKPEQLDGPLQPFMVGLAQEVYVFATWLDKNPCRISAGPIFKKHAENKALLYTSAAELALTLGVTPIDLEVDMQHATFAYHHIRKPSQTGRFQ